LPRAPHNDATALWPKQWSAQDLHTALTPA
jgi:hypothetical protein